MKLVKGTTETTVFPFFPGPLNRAELANQAVALGASNYGDGASLTTINDLNLPSDTQDWFTSTRPTSDSQVATYAVVVDNLFGRVDIIYWWFFPYNQGKTIASTSWGNHVGDFVRVKVSLQWVNFQSPGSESVLRVRYYAHSSYDDRSGAQADMVGKQAIARMANGDHEIYYSEGLWSRPGPSYDYTKRNPYRFNTRFGNMEIYQWNPTASDWIPPPPASPASFKDTNWLKFKGRWGNWEAGSITLFGQDLIAQREKGTDSLNRPADYVLT
jgi:hypothetical protein